MNNKQKISVQGISLFTGKYIGTRRIGRFDLTLSLYVHKNKKQVLHFLNL